MRCWTHSSPHWWPSWAQSHQTARSLGSGEQERCVCGGGHTPPNPYQPLALGCFAIPMCLSCVILMCQSPLLPPMLPQCVNTPSLPLPPLPSPPGMPRSRCWMSQAHWSTCCSCGSWWCGTQTCSTSHAHSLCHRCGHTVGQGRGEVLLLLLCGPALCSQHTRTTDIGVVVGGDMCLRAFV